ncbi:hypothetical protein B0T19DRAFT_189126 [Cercophora scortea]|uniref:Extracellular membrane protein CFEM domain-containing protein n=1 Tax=Cercophora scortea TaxID=314031 RepID=A0AAE0INN2_9PEZI|nr:hypothetical protein B0T19DRAFT_189126 [Cercophora scortea]
MEMWPRRMAFKPFLCFLLWTASSRVSNATFTSIPDEIENFVPSCAKQCFHSFILANFDSSVCGESPSLQCLCTQTGTTGYTIGEGAVLCTVAESNRGTCSGVDTNTVSVGYNMCGNVANAASRTHPTIVATLVAPSGTGPLVVPTVTATATSTTTTSSVTSNTATPTFSAPTVVASTATPSQTASSSPPQLTSAQIAGISLGCAAVVAFGVLLVVLARCVRRRRFGDPESGFSKMSDSWSFGRKSNSHPSSPHMMQISAPIHNPPATLDFRRPPPGAIGLAVSPHRAEMAVSNATRTNPALRTPLSTMVLPQPPRMQTPTRDPSPPKPALTLAIPKAPTATVAAPTNARDSIVTEFAEDGDPDSLPGTSIWRPPPTDPQSATSYYFADKGGNWILRNKSTRKPELGQIPATPELELPSPQDKTKAERAQDAYAGFSPNAAVSPLRVPSKSAQAKLGSPIAFKDQRKDRRVSRPYSTVSGPLPFTPESADRIPASKQTAAAPDGFFVMTKDTRELVGGKTKRRASRRASRRVSQDSATSIESGAAGSGDDDIMEDEQENLSPVVESPGIEAGRSPVSYPKIRHQNEGQSLMPGNAPGFSMFPPPPRREDLNASHQPSPTLGAAVVVDIGPKRLMNVPTLNPVPNRNPGQLRTGSPETRVAVEQQRQRPPQQRQQPQQHRHRNEQRHSSVGYWDEPQPQAERRRPSPAYELPAENDSQQNYRAPPKQQQYQQQQQQQQQQRRQAPRPEHASQSNARHEHWRPPQPPKPQPQQQNQRVPQQMQSQYRPTQQIPDVGQSKLLAKRLGAEKAATLALGSGGQIPVRKTRDGWARESIGPPNLTPGASENKTASDRYVDLEMPPITPGWVPELTPTRRGDDLFLNVQ